MSVDSTQQIQAQHFMWIKALLAQESDLSPYSNQFDRIATASFKFWKDTIQMVGYTPIVYSPTEIETKQIPDFVLECMWKSYPFGYCPPSLKQYCRTTFGKRPNLPSVRNIKLDNGDTAVVLRDAPANTAINITIDPINDYGLDSNGSGDLIITTALYQPGETITIDYSFGQPVSASGIVSAASGSASENIQAQPFYNASGYDTIITSVQRRVEPVFVAPPVQTSPTIDLPDGGLSVGGTVINITTGGSGLPWQQYAPNPYPSLTTISSNPFADVISEDKVSTNLPLLIGQKDIISIPVPKANGEQFGRVVVDNLTDTTQRRNIVLWLTTQGPAQTNQFLLPEQGIGMIDDVDTYDLSSERAEVNWSSLANKANYASIGTGVWYINISIKPNDGQADADTQALNVTLERQS